MSRRGTSPGTDPAREEVVAVPFSLDDSLFPSPCGIENVDSDLIE